MGRRGNRRDEYEEEEEDNDWWDVMVKMGMPILYIIGVATGIVGAICQGVITNYWAGLEPGNCFLYSKTASTSVVYEFGCPIGVCYWITYGSVVSIIIASITGLIYTIQVRGNKDLTYTSACTLTGILVAMLLMLAVTCTMAQGLRLTCTSMGLNSANNKGESCYEKLDRRVSGDQLPVQTSTMVRSALITLICSTTVFFIISCFHISDFYKRTLRYRYGGVARDDYR